MRTRVLIVGAGPAGLVLAAVLAAHEVDFTIVDAKSGPVTQSRAAILHVRTLELLDRLGLADRAVAQGVRTTGVEIFERGRRAGGFSLAGQGAADRTPFPYALGLEQDRTERLLVEWLAERGHGIEWDTELVALSDHPDGARAVVRRATGVRDTIAAGWVVGADGARSRVRRALGIDFPGGTYDQTGLLADVDIDFPAGAGPPAGTLRLNLTRDGFVGMFPLASGRYRLFGAVPPGLAPPGTRQEASHEPYADVPSARIQDWFDTSFSVDARLTAAAWTALFRIHSRIAGRFRAGNTFLVGDAAHLHSPAGGQGMNLAIGDAFNLGWKLALAANGQAHERLLDSYEAERRPVAAAVLRGTDRAFALETRRHPIARWIRSHIAARLLGPLTRLPAVRAGVFRLFSQTWIGYRHSPAVAGGSGRARGPRPGDRAPYGRFEATRDGAPGDLFDVIGGTPHHVLLFEGAEPGPAVAAHRRLVEDLLGRYPVEMRVHTVPAGEKTLHARYGARGSRLFLIRPDGHLAYTGPPHEIGRFADYLDRLYTRHTTSADGRSEPGIQGR
ncbi:FAD-dependent monooxygenase [Nonomuraea sp. M3C6]|uniref:FAD-dependent monooxygenase n=1 Tax=Nonomuraea marmarensis TaxID=3351344 RepID=A0ABW7AQW7_9ACTN